jgi:hypothetical protein
MSSCLLLNVWHLVANLAILAYVLFFVEPNHLILRVAVVTRVLHDDNIGLAGRPGVHPRQPLLTQTPTT